jgi:V-type H+-transporting ATPase subunit a
MFGDIGHGGLLFAFSIILCLFCDQLKQFPSMAIFIQIRYLLLLMGAFAFYMGLIYNDFMSLPLSLFGQGCYEK